MNKFVPDPKSHITDHDDEYDVDYLAHYYVRYGLFLRDCDMDEYKAFKVGFEIGYLRAVREFGIKIKHEP